MIKNADLVKVALDLFCEKGYQRASLPEIYKIASKNKSNYQNYYSSKKDLLISAVHLAEKHNHTVMICIPPLSRGRRLTEYVEVVFETLAGICKTATFIMSLQTDPIVSQFIPAYTAEIKMEYAIDFFTPYLPSLSNPENADTAMILVAVIDEFLLSGDFEVAVSSTLRLLRFAGATETVRVPAEMAVMQ